MKKIIWLFTLSIVLCVSQLTREYENCVVINYDHSVLFHWTVHLESQQISFGFHGNLGGYIGVALSNNGKIVGGPPINYTDSWAIDTNFRYVDLYFTQSIFDITSQPVTDIQQNLKNASLSYNGTTLFGEFYRAINTSDPEDYVISLNTSTFLLWAGHMTQPWVEGIGFANHRTQGTGFEGAISINFGRSSSCVSQNTPGVWVSSAGDFQVNWDMTADGKSINFTMVGNTLGWIGIGISNVSKMAPSDVYVGWIIEGELYLYDCYSGDYNQPVIDSQQDITTSYGYQEDGKTTIFFQRPLITGDSQDWNITHETLYLMYALANVPGSGETYPMHTSIGITPVSFFGDPDVVSSGPIGQIIPKNETFRPNGPTYVSPDGMFSIVIEKNETEIYFEMQGKTTGWISIGLSYDSLMTSSDTYTGWINPDGTVVLRDEWSPNLLQPFQDIERNGTDDAYLTDALEADGYTRIAFKRKFITGDKYDYQIPDSQIGYLIWAVGAEDGNAYGYSEHFLTGDVAVKLLQSDPFVVPPQFRPGQLLLMMVASIMLIWSSIRSMRYFKKSMRKRQVYRSEAKHPEKKVFVTPNDESRSETQVDMLTTYINVGDDLDQDAEIPINSTHTLPPPPDSPPPRGVVFMNGKYIGNLFVSNVSCDEKPKPDADSSSSTNSNTNLQNHNSNEPITPESDIYTSPSDEKLSLHNSGIYPQDPEDPGPIVPDVSIIPVNFEETQENPAVVPDPTPWTGSLTSKTNTTILHIIEGMVTYRIPNTHISVGDVITAVTFLCLNVICVFVFQDIRLSLSIDGAVSNLGSLLGANCVLTVMVVTKNSLLVILLGIPFDRVIPYHRWLGRFCCLLAILHLSLVTAKYSKVDSSLFYIVSQWVALVSPTLNLYGLVSAICLLFILMSSLEWIRRSKYEIFIILHYVLFTALFIFGALHTSAWWWFAAVALILYGMDIVIRIFWGTLPQKTSLAIVKVGGITQIRIPKRLPFLNKGRVGQYVFVNVPSISLHEWHPFSVSSAPFEREIEIHVRPAGDWTTQLKTLVETHQKQLWIRVDGPYGHLNLNYRRYENILLVAGGVGITPVIGFLKTIYFNPKRVQSRIRNVTTIWAIGAEEEATLFSKEFDVMMKIAWINGEMPVLDLRIHLTSVTEGQPVPFGIFPGRPDMASVFKKMAKDMQNNACFVFVCGPKPLVNICWDISRQHALRGKAFHFHHETFLL